MFLRNVPFVRLGRREAGSFPYRKNIRGTARDVSPTLLEELEGAALSAPFKLGHDGACPSKEVEAVRGWSVFAADFARSGHMFGHGGVAVINNFAGAGDGDL